MDCCHADTVICPSIVSFVFEIERDEKVEWKSVLETLSVLG